jgi:ABC-type nitrate/sulfonate/bicarbonate transport system permease component
MSLALRKLLLGAAGLAGGVLCWALLQRLLALPLHILPSPWSVARALGNGFAVADADENWMPLVAGTFGIGLAGWVAGGLAGIAIGAVLTAGRPVEYLARPWLGLFGGAAGVAAAPLVLYWGGLGLGAKLLLAAGLAFFPMVRAALAGLRAAPAGWHDVMRGFSASGLETFLRLRLPMALPGLCGGLRDAWTLALAGVLIAEFLGAPGGLGAQIAEHQAAFDLAGAIAGLIVVAVIGTAIAYLLARLERGVTDWIDPARRA